MNIGLQTQLFIFHSMLNPFNRRKEGCKVNDKFGIGETEFFTYK